MLTLKIFGTRSSNNRLCSHSTVTGLPYPEGQTLAGPQGILTIYVGGAIHQRSFSLSFRFPDTQAACKALASFSLEDRQFMGDIWKSSCKEPAETEVAPPFRIPSIALLLPGHKKCDPCCRNRCLNI